MEDIKLNVALFPFESAVRNRCWLHRVCPESHGSQWGKRAGVGVGGGVGGGQVELTGGLSVILRDAESQ